MRDATLLAELRQNHKHLMQMLKHTSDELNKKLDLALLRITSEEETIKTLPEREEHWFRQLAFQAAKIYGEEHELTRHYKEAYKLETGREWDEISKE